MIEPILLLVAGFALLIVGGEALVRGSVALAERAGLSPLFIGIALVGFGTSVPELVTAVQASLRGVPDLAIGSIVGSNISNILLVIGASSLLIPLTANVAGIRRDGTIVLAVALLFAITSALSPLSQTVGAMYLGLLFSYLVFAYLHETLAQPNGHTAPIDMAHALPRLGDEPEMLTKKHVQYTDKLGWVLPFLMTITGIATIILGGSILVDGAVGLARMLDISETVIGLTIVAIGTSMPELATSIIAAYRRATDVAVGNILGSNIYNTLGIGGVIGVLAPTDVPHQIVTYDNLVVIAATITLIAIAVLSKGKIHRPTGAALVGAYGLYIWSVWPH